MNCDDFGFRMQQCLDQRQSPETDNALQRHAGGCDSCRGQLQAWRNIASVMAAGTYSASPSEISSRQMHNKVWIASGMAAALLLFVTKLYYQPSVQPVSMEFVIVDQQTNSVSGNLLADVDPQTWWRGIQDRDWIGQTMPTVKSLQEGVAPLGRSLKRAVTILAIGGHDQTS